MSRISSLRSSVADQCENTAGIPKQSTQKTKSNHRHSPPSYMSAPHQYEALLSIPSATLRPRNNNETIISTKSSKSSKSDQRENHTPFRDLRVSQYQLMTAAEREIRLTSVYSKGASTTSDDGLECRLHPIRRWLRLLQGNPATNSTQLDD